MSCDNWTGLFALATTFSKLLLTIVEITIAQVTFAQAAIVQDTIVQNRHKGIESGSWEERAWTEAQFEAHFYQIRLKKRADNTPFVVTDLDVAVILMASG